MKKDFLVDCLFYLLFLEGTFFAILMNLLWGKFF